MRPRRASLLLVSMAALLLHVAVPRPVRAQVNTGAIIGKVTDPSGAVVAGADVAIQNLSTGVKLSGKTNEVGDFAFRGLLTGTYKLNVTHPGFRSAEVTNILVAVAETTTHNIALAIGEPATSVTVEASVAGVDTASATLGTVVTQREVRDLPLNGRNFTQLLTLTTGVANIGTAGSWGNPQVGTFTLPSINGQSSKSTQWLLDGTNNSSPGFALISVAPVVDDVAEFKVVSHADSAEYGGVLGGVVNVVSKSGTNELHGGVWEFLRNDKLDARNPFRPSVVPLKMNQFGGNVGGPVVIPKLYNGRNRTFFFGSYQGFRQSRASTVLYRVPTPAEMNGDLSGENPIFDPFSTRPDPANPARFLRDPFPNKMIPPSRIDPIAKQHAAKVYPAPVSTGFAGTNGINPTPERTNQDMFTFRGDHQMQSDSISYRFTRVETAVLTAGDGGLAGSTFRRAPHGYNMGANYTHTLGPTTLFHVMFARSYIDLDLRSKWNSLDESDFAPQLYAQDFACGFVGGFGPKKCYLPFLQVPGFAGVNEFSARVGQTDIWEFKPDISVIRGRHTVKGGFSYAQHKMWAVTQRAFVGYEATQTADLQNPAGTGNALASFLLGVPAGSERADAPNSMKPARIYGFFIQDQWKISSKLTFNYGLRYDANILPNFGDPSFYSYLKDVTVENQYSGNMDLLRGRFLLPKVPPSCASKGRAPCIPTPDGSLPAHVELAPNGRVFQNIFDNWQPRLGIAYSITAKTVLRAGAGRYFDSWNETTLAASQQEGLWPDVRRVSNYLLNRTTVEARSSNPLALAGTLPAPNPFFLTTTGRDPFMKNPQSDQFNLGVEHQLTGTTVLSANYVGSRGRRIPTGSIWNTAVKPGPGDPVARRPYPYINPASVIKDWSRNWYDSLQVTLDRKFSKGFSGVVSYTWSKSLDLGSSDGFGGSAQDPYNLWLDKGVSGLNLPHILSLGWVYELPFGRGRRLQSGSRALDAVIGDWQFNGLAQFTSGAPYGISVCGDGANVGRGGCYLRPNVVGDPKISNPSPARWFNTGAFQAPAQYTYGSLARNPYRGEAYKNFDMSLFRDFPIRERLKMQFRFETFNALNMVTLGNPNGTYANINFGKIFGTRSTERQLQFGLKLYF